MTDTRTIQTGPGRPKAPITEEHIVALARAGCTVEEMAAFLNVNKKTIERRFKKAMERGRNSRNASLRRKQFDKAMEGNPAMLIWLGKQWLGQSDKAQITGKDDGPIQHAHDLSSMTNEQLDAEIAKLLPAVASGTGTPGDPSSGTPAAA